MNDDEIIILPLSHSFLAQVRSELEKALLVQGVHTILPSALLRLAQIVLTKVPSDGSTRAT